MNTLRIDGLWPAANGFLQNFLVAFFLFQASEALKKDSSKFFFDLKRKYAKDIDYFLLTNKHITTLKIFSDEFGFEIKLWVKNGRNAQPSLINSIRPVLPRGVINIDCPFSNAYEGPVFTKSSLILQWNKYSSASKLKTIFAHVAEHLSASEDDIKQKWGSTVVEFLDERKFFKKFGIGFQVIHRTPRKNKRTDVRIVYRSTLKNFLTLEFSKPWLINKEFLDSNDLFIIGRNLNFQFCETENCGFASDHKNTFERHIKSCKGITEFKYKQVKLTTETPWKLLRDKGYVDIDYQQKYFVSFDIETMSDRSAHTQVTSVTTELNTQRLISIALTKNFGKNRSVALKRREMTENSYKDLLLEFKHTLYDMANEYLALIPKKIKDSYTEITNRLEIHHKTENKLSVRNYSNLRSCQAQLRRLLMLPVVGFNSEHFDLPILLPGLLKIWAVETVSVIKRGCGIMSMELSPLIFLDARNFIAGSNLIKFGKTWNSKAEKSLFPYEYFTTIESMKQAIYWPTYQSFRSSLKTFCVENFGDKLIFGLNKYKLEIEKTGLNVDSFLESKFGITDVSQLSSLDGHSICPIEYIENYIGYEKLKLVGSIKNMFDYLLFYNIKDTEVLSEAFENYCKAFYDTFEISPLGFSSLPGMSEKILWNYYDNNLNSPYSFSEEFKSVNQLIRKNLQGGLVAVFHRHAATISSSRNLNSLPKAVQYLDNGEPISELIGFDFNSK